MQITCPNCATAYQIAASAIGAAGRSVRCARCHSIWFQAAPDEMPPEPASATASEGAGNEVTGAFGASTPAAAASAADTRAADPGETAAGPSPDDHAAAQVPEATAGATGPADTEAAPGAQDERPALALSDIPIPAEPAPPLVPAPGEGALPEAGAIDNGSEDIETVAARRRARNAARRRKSQRSVPVPAVIAVLVVICVALIGLRKDVVRHVPQMASLYASIGLPVNLRGLTFSNLRIGNETHDGVPVLVVEGTIVNTVSMPVDVPRLRFALRSASGAEVYAWTAMPSQPVLEPFESLPFRTRLASPPAEGHDVQVRFFTRRDAVAGLH
jgi:predicted Zn finger-like uncharacterized protein